MLENTQEFTPLFPEWTLRKLAREVFLTLGAVALVMGCWISSFWNENFLGMQNPLLQKAALAQKAPIALSLFFSDKKPSLPLPTISPLLSISAIPPRPNEREAPSLWIFSKETKETLPLTLPCRVDLFHRGSLCFTEKESSFWIELFSLGKEWVGGEVFIKTPDQETVLVEKIKLPIEEIPLQNASFFKEGAPLRLLAEARWWGVDPLRKQYGDRKVWQRIEIGPIGAVSLLDLEEGSFLIWDGAGWKASKEAGEGLCVRLFSQQPQSLLFEAWDREAYHRFSIPLAPPSKAPLKGEPLFSSVRIRSKKKMSCMLEKQWLILSVGDWVLRGEQRWRSLKKQEEKEAFLKGDLVGELLIFDGIKEKGRSQVIYGHLCNAARSQMNSFEVPVGPQKEKKHPREKKR